MGEFGNIVPFARAKSAQTLTAFPVEKQSLPSSWSASLLERCTAHLPLPTKNAPSPRQPRCHKSSSHFEDRTRYKPSNTRKTTNGTSLHTPTPTHFDCCLFGVPRACEGSAVHVTLTCASVFTTAPASGNDRSATIAISHHAFLFLLLPVLLHVGLTEPQSCSHGRAPGCKSLLLLLLLLLPEEVPPCVDGEGPPDPGLDWHQLDDRNFQPLLLNRLALARCSASFRSAGLGSRQIDHVSVPNDGILLHAPKVTAPLLADVHHAVSAVPSTEFRLGGTTLPYDGCLVYPF